MDEKQVNGTQADEEQGTEAEDEVEAGETVDGDALDDVNGSDVPDVEKMRRLRLSGFLRELVREEGRMEAAELLGVNYRTLVKAEESGELTGRMSDALERLLGTGEDPEGGATSGPHGGVGVRHGSAGEGHAGQPRRDSGCSLWRECRSQQGQPDAGWREWSV